MRYRDRAGYARGKFLWALFALAVVAGGVLAWRELHHQQPTPPKPEIKHVPATQSAAPATATAPVPPAPSAHSFVEWVRFKQPAYSTTQPLNQMLPFKQALHLVIDEPVYLDTFKNLWVTRDDAEPTPVVLQRAAREDFHVTRQRPLFVQWMVIEHKTRALLVCPKSPPAGLEDNAPPLPAPGPVQLIDGARQTLMGSAQRFYDWARAINFAGQIVVPTDAGASVFVLTVTPEILSAAEIPSPSLVDLPLPTLDTARKSPRTSPSPGTPGEGWGGGNSAELLSHATSTAATPSTTQPVRSQITGDLHGLLVWIPPQGSDSGGKGAVRFIDGHWVRLGPDKRWPGDIVHLVPLADGTVVQILRDRGDADAPAEEDQVITRSVPLDAAEIDETKVKQLVAQLSDDDSEKRADAAKQLGEMPPSIWPLLEKMLDDQGPDAQIAMRRIMRSHDVPTFGELRLLDGRLKLLMRQSDQSVLFYAPGGISIPRGEEEPELLAHAWLGLRPGEAVQLLNEHFINGLDLQRNHFAMAGREWVVTDDVKGPCWFTGNDFLPMLRKNEMEFTELVGRDLQGRWLMRKPQSASPTLVIDQRLPDGTPRLPAWDIVCQGGSVGWDSKNYPAMKRGSAAALEEGTWRLIDNDSDYHILVENPPAPAPQSQPATSTAPTTTAADGPPLLVDPQGNRYFDGQNALKVIAADGHTTIWPLPARATGDGKVTLIRSPDGRLFLFNLAGRVVRITPTPGKAEPFVMDAIFSHGIPDTDHPTRIWLDPLGRIIVAYENHLALLFPSGVIPKSTADLIPAKDLEEPEE